MGNQTINRRSFLQATSGASAGLLLGAGGSGRAGAPRRVIVLGGGLAGLSAAYELLAADPACRVTLLEARTRLGGRVHTVRTSGDDGSTPLADGQYCEAGAHRILETHDRTLGYVHQFGLGARLVEYSRSLGRGAQGSTLLVLRGERVRLGAGGDWPAGLALSAQERASRLLLRDGASFDYAARLYPAVHGTEVFATGAEQWHAQDALHGGAGRNYTLRGGLDQLPQAVAQAVRERGGAIHLGVAVTRIRQSAAGVTVTCSDTRTGLTTMVSGDRCVCTLPFPVLRDRVDLRGAGLDSDKLRSIGELQMMPAGRVYLQTRSRFWQQEGLEGLQLAGTDTPIERIWNSGNVQPGAAGLIHSYVQLHNAAAMGHVPAGERLRLLRDQMAGVVFPQITGEWNGLGFAKLWAEDKWSGGGAWLARKPGTPDQLHAGLEVLARAQGRVHFAGEHTVREGGWMQGAIESGQRAAHEALSA